MQADTWSGWFLKLMDHHNFVPFSGMVVGVIAIITIATVIITVSRLWLTHRQRMAMIRQGMHPDAVVIDEPLAQFELTQAPAEKPIYKAIG
jgi:hypothetical protein